MAQAGIRSQLAEDRTPDRHFLGAVDRATRIAVQDVHDVHGREFAAVVLGQQREIGRQSLAPAPPDDFLFRLLHERRIGGLFYAHHGFHEGTQHQFARLSNSPVRPAVEFGSG
jgi:hypothetical protein